jgi:hypothetical protein
MARRSSGEELSLHDIESGLAELLAAREEATEPEEQLQCDLAIAAYCQAEVAKVDGIARYARLCKEQHEIAKAEAERLKARAAAWDGRRKRLLDFVKNIMQLTGRRRIEGKLNTLILKANGGNRAVIVDDLSLVPDWYFDAHVVMRWDTWIAIVRGNVPKDLPDGVYVDRVERLSEIHAALQFGPVPGCRLAERNEHVEIK